MASDPKYLFETFESDSSIFDSELSECINGKHESGWEYENCRYATAGDRRSDYCLLERS